MAAELEAIQIQLWVLTALLTLILLAAGYCNYSRIKSKNETSPFEYMEYLSEAELFEELREYSAVYLKGRPNSSKALFFHAMAHFRLGNHDIARFNATKLANTSPSQRESALTLLKMIDAAAGGS